jgi:hypothetical protein
MSEKMTFRAVIQDPGGSGAFVDVPFDVEQVYGKKRVKVRATIDGVPYRGSLVRMGGECHMLLVLKSIREQIGKTFGDEVEISLEEDTEPRVVEVPADLRQRLDQDRQADEFFQKMSYSHQREYVLWITSAKQAQARQRRIHKAIQMLVEGKFAR